MIESKPKTYSVDPTYLEHIGNILSRAAGQTAFAEICKDIIPLLAARHEISGLDNIPTEGSLVMVKNHPFHFDGLLMGALFAERPDVRLLAKSAPYTSALPSSNALILRKDSDKANPHDIAALQAYLKEGGSLLATPWGAMDHQARSHTTSERAAHNAAKYVTFNNAALLPVHIDVTWRETRSLPVRSASISVQEPIMAADKDAANKIHAAVTSMYQAYVS